MYCVQYPYVSLALTKCFQSFYTSFVQHSLSCSLTWLAQIFSMCLAFTTKVINILQITGMAFTGRTMRKNPAFIPLAPLYRPCRRHSLHCRSLRSLLPGILHDRTHHRIQKVRTHHRIHHVHITTSPISSSFAEVSLPTFDTRSGH